MIGAGRAAVIDDFRTIELYEGKNRNTSRRGKLPLSSQDKGHTALLAAAFDYFAGGDRPPIPTERLIETTRATLLARDALAIGEEGPIRLPSYRNGAQVRVSRRFRPPLGRLTAELSP